MLQVTPLRFTGRGRRAPERLFATETAWKWRYSDFDNVSQTRRKSLDLSGRLAGLDERSATAYA
jgi:hypothetical protein